MVGGDELRSRFARVSRTHKQRIVSLFPFIPPRCGDSYDAASTENLRRAYSSAADDEFLVSPPIAPGLNKLRRNTIPRQMQVSDMRSRDSCELCSASVTQANAGPSFLCRGHTTPLIYQPQQVPLNKALRVYKWAAWSDSEFSRPRPGPKSTPPCHESGTLVVRISTEFKPSHLVGAESKREQECAARRDERTLDLQAETGDRG
ncbi:hypothetical protein CMUS01_16196 [Colletotrichum musicola]|uniref:Uncharacterized protein n=1 Tax=Colletotrichum musicola TaxID=2175873 RepID=A0A8H6IRC4_9PEZI|nr:hypothetical protein CMUS01_16196 [Colletotrichum musicola]